MSPARADLGPTPDLSWWHPKDAAPAAPPGPQAAAPEGTDGTVTTPEDTLYVFSRADFGFSDSDGHAFAGVVIATEPTNGSLAFDGGAVGAGSFIAVADIDAGRLKFEAGLDQSGLAYASFSFRVVDSSGAQDASPNILAVNVTPVNDAPVYRNFNSGSAGTFTEGQVSPQLLDFMHNGEVLDIDSVDFVGGFLRVSITQNGIPAEDRLGIASGGAVTISGTAAGSSVTVNGVVIGTIAAAGTGIGEDLVVTLGAGATPARTELLIRALTYVNTNQASPSQATRSVAITLNDGDGPQLGTTVLTVGIMGINDAPVLTAPTQSQVQYLPGNAAVPLWAGVTVVDPDGQASFVGGNINMSGGGAGARIELIGTRFIASNASGSIDIIDTTTNMVIGSLTLTTANASIGGLTAAATPAVVNALIQSFGFRTEGANPALGNFEAHMTLFDGQSGGFGGGLTSNMISQTISVGSLSSVPAVDLNGNGPGLDWTHLYIENGTPVGLGNGSLLVLDANGGNQIDRATVVLTNLDEGDVLTYGALPAGVTAVLTVSPDQISLVFTGPATPLAYQTLLAGVRYYSTSENPSVSQRRIGVNVESDSVASATAFATVHIAQVDDPSVGRPDSFTTNAAAIVTGSVFADNGSGPDTDPDSVPLVVAVNGAATVNNQITLPSGATLLLFGGGSFTYNPNHAFDALPGPGSGASNATTTDSFTYSLQGGGGATVTIAIAGIDGNDTLRGTMGSDRLYGGIGADIFVFTQVAESRIYALRSDGEKHMPDLLGDFVSGVDRVDLSAIDAIAGTGANDAFTFIGAAAFGGQAGQLRVVSIGGAAQIFGDVDGDGHADFQISVAAPVLVGADFIL